MGRDLAQLCRERFSRPTAMCLWVACELAIIACDLAEVIGSAIALQLLFGLPLIFGVCATALDVCLILWLQNRGFRYIEALVMALLCVIGGCFAFELVIAQPDVRAIAAALLPSRQIVTDPARISEIAEASTKDVCQIGGIWCIKILLDDRDEDAELKNEDSHRIVALHS